MKKALSLLLALLLCTVCAAPAAAASAPLTYKVTEFGFAMVADCDDNANGTVKIKRMADGEEKTVPVSDAVETVNRMNS